MSRRSSVSGSGLRGFVTYFWLPVALFALWWFGSASSSSFFLPPLSSILGILWTDLLSGELIRQMAFSMRNVMAGLAISITLGLCLGIAIGKNPQLRAALWPFLAFLRAVPGVAVIPVVLVALGVGPGPQIFIIVFACTWPILLNTIDGVRGIKESVIDMARAYRLPRWLYIRKILVPAALPQTMAGIRISLSVSLTLMVVSEFSAGNAGLGRYIMMGSEMFNPARVWAGTIFVGIIGYLLNVIFLFLERRLLGWYFGVPRREARKSRTAPWRAQPLTSETKA